MTGCGCLLLVGALAVLLYVLVFGSTDAAETIEQASALAIGLYTLARRRLAPQAADDDERRVEERSDYAARAGRRSLQLVARS